MARPKKEVKEDKVQEETIIVQEVQSPFARLLDIYKLQNPKKYELKEEELLKKLELNK